MGKLFVIIASLMIITPAHAEPLDAKKLGTYCDHLTGIFKLPKAFKCAWNVAGSTASVKDAKRHELEAEETSDPNKATHLRNKAAYERAEADRYADEYRRNYAPRP